MSDDIKKVETEDELDMSVEDEFPEKEEPEVEEEVKETKPKKKAKTTKAKKESKPEEKTPSKGELWWNEKGLELVRKGHSERSVVLKAARAAGVSVPVAIKAMHESGTLEDKAVSLFG